ncbi:MAG: ribonuclease H-like domain-containing protein [Lachnospiraceae bacterium]|nr:ribonuclease H-like domain-containing protein [Lachnospiraceae bacterium]
MKIFEHTYDGIRPGYPIDNMAPLNEILFIDIETTGLSREYSDLYLIGCGFFDDNGYNTVQWFAASAADEPLIIKEFTAYVREHFSLLIHYNGNRFDVPFLKAKAHKHGLDDPFDTLSGFDIYSEIKPYKNILGLPSLRQRCVEELLDIRSDDPYSGRELIDVYKAYRLRPDDELLSMLLYHNSEDLKGMAYILPVLYYTSLKDATLEYVSHSLNDFTDYHGNPRQELITEYSHDLDIPKGFISKHDDIMLSMRSDHRAILRLPLINATLRRFYDNYGDYYYLPYEDCCIHKSAASGVDKSRRENAKKETCYTKYSGLFIPCLISDPSPVFRESYDSKNLYLPYTESTIVKVLTETGRELIGHTF